MGKEEKIEKAKDKEQEYEQQLDQLTQLAEEENVSEVADVLDLPKDAVALSLKCVGDGRRKSKLEIGGERKKITHFSHMARVAFMVKNFFPEDKSGRLLAMLHDTKEEAKEGREETYKQSSITDQIDLLTEEDVTEKEIGKVKQVIPEGFNAKYIAKYRKYIKRLHENWDSVGAMELCDRLDGSTSYEYLLNPKYENRMPHKALESFGRTWATLHGQSNEVADRIRQNSRLWFDKFDITEKKVEETAGLFL